MAFPDLTPFNWIDAPSTATPITAANLEDMQTTIYDAVRADMAQKIHEAAPSIEYWGARPSNTGAQNVTAIQAAVNAANKVVVPAGKQYDINARIIVPDRTTIQLDGDLRAVAGTWTAESVSNSAHAMLYWRVPSGTEGHDGGMTGRGKLKCNGLARYGTDVESWDNITFHDFKIEDPVDAHMHFRPGPSRPDGVGTSVDCDACDLAHLTCGYDGTITAKPLRGILMRDAGGNDSEIRNCKLNGFAEQNPLGDTSTGGVGIEIRNSGRIKIVSCYVGDNNRKITAGIKIRTETPDDPVYHERPTTIRDFYTEAGVSASPPSAAWIYSAVMISVQAGISVAGSKEHIIDGLELVAGNISTPANLRRLWLANSGTAGVLSNVRYTNPRDHLTAAGQILISAGSNNNLIELMSAGSNTVGSLSGEAAFVTNNGTGNKIRNLLSPDP